MSKIITVTPNTAIDLTVEIEGLARKDNILAEDSCEFICGKGVNVARGVASMGQPVTCLGFVGQHSMPAFATLASGLVHTDFTPVTGKTRTNITLFDRSNRRETHIRTTGFSVTIDDCRKLKNHLATLLEPGDVVALSGSLPPGAPDDFYAELIEQCHRKQAIALLDSRGESLRKGQAATPYLIKPNQQELEEISGQELPDEKSIVSAARERVKQGLTWVYVSRGPKGVIIVGQRQAFAANIVTPPSSIMTHIGCGDAMVAGLALATLNHENMENCIKIAVASGVANLYSREPGQFDQQLHQQLLPQININRLSF